MTAEWSVMVTGGAVRREAVVGWGRRPVWPWPRGCVGVGNDGVGSGGGDGGEIIRLGVLVGKGVIELVGHQLKLWLVP